jgi:predicted transposase/invertase (TIGR01784 family)
LPNLKLADKCRKIAYNVNAFKKVGDENVRKLLEFISTGKSETSLTNKISNELRRVQGNEEWRAEYMTLEMLKKDTYDSGFTAGEKAGEERGISIGLSQGITQGAHQKAVETAKSMILRNISIDIVAECTGLSPEEIEKL